MLNEQENLLKTIQALIDRRIEGLFWDFKLQHHENRAELIHDVLCLANADHDGPRFLIYGVKDETFELHSIEKSPNRKTQADIVSIFRDNASKFFQSRTPNLFLREVQVGPNTIDVLVIENQPHKPYYLVESYPCNRCSRRVALKHHIYTRVGDTNTPMTDTAPPHEIERMWRERFGLDKPPLERAKGYLGKPESWLPMSELDGIGDTYHHEVFPEFVLRVDDANDAKLGCNQEWTRGEVRRDNNSAGYLKLYYHQTLLARAYYVTFDDNRKSMIVPDLRPRGIGRFYYYLADSIEYALQGFWSALHREDHSRKLTIRGKGQINDEARSLWPRGMHIPVLRMQELEEFLEGRGADAMLIPSMDKTEQYQLFIRNQLEFELWRRRSEEDT